MVQKVQPSHIFTVKNKCPYCGSNLYAHAEGWEQRSNGLWKVTDLNVECSTVPDIDSDEFDRWQEEHSILLYEYWHPVVDNIMCHINMYFEFDL